MQGDEPPPQLIPEEESSFFDSALGWEGWETLSPWILIAGIGLGYVLLIFQHPLRSSFHEGWALMKDKGNGWALLGVILLAMALAGASWYVQKPLLDSLPGDPGEGASISADTMVGAVLEITGSVVASVAPRAGETFQAVDLPWFARWLLAALVFMAGFLVLQMLYSFFTIRTVMPGRILRFGALLELSLQHCLRVWPVVLILVLGWPAILLFAPEGVFRWILGGLAFLFFAAFVFLHPAATNAEARKNPLEVALSCWKKRVLSALWFLLMLVIHGVLLGLLRHAGSVNIVEGTAAALVAELFLAFLTGLIVVWLTASWAVFYTRAFPARK